MKASLLSVLLLCQLAGYAQGIIVNEISQGPAGQQEFIELLVVGSSSQPMGVVDLSDWIIDDNNGDFLLTGGGVVGLATGHFRFTANDTLSAVPIGSLIVLYNAGDKNPSWTFDSVDIAGNDIAYIDSVNMVYYIPGTSTLLRSCSGTPSASSTSYVYTSSTIPPTAANWTGTIGLANGGDAVQTRLPDGTFYHGFGFSTPTLTDTFLTVPSFSPVGLPSFNGYKGSAIGMTTYLDCGNWYFPGNFLTGGSAVVETPGLANTTDNAELIQSVKDGVFDYPSLPTDLPCPIILPVNLLEFKAQRSRDKAIISWRVADDRRITSFELERSVEGSAWNSISVILSKGTGEIHYEKMDEYPAEGLNLYRLKILPIDGKPEYSPVASINFGDRNATFEVYPNPGKSDITVDVKTGLTAVFTILDATGHVLLSKQIASGSNRVNTASLSPGMYLIRLELPDGTTQIRKFIRE